MKKLLNLFLVLCLGVEVSVGVINAAQAATTDFFQITVTVGYISISLLDRDSANYTTWAIGSLSASSVATMTANSGSGLTEKGILVSNESNVSIDLGSYATNSLGWALVSGTPGANEYRLKADGFAGWQSATYPNMASATTITATSSPGTEYDTGVSANTPSYHYYQFAAPSSVSTGGSNTITVTVEATGS